MITGDALNQFSHHRMANLNLIVLLFVVQQTYQHCNICAPNGLKRNWITLLKIFKCWNYCYIYPHFLRTSKSARHDSRRRCPVIGCCPSNTCEVIQLSKLLVCLFIFYLSPLMFADSYKLTLPVARHRQRPVLRNGAAFMPLRGSQTPLFFYFCIA